MADILIVDDTPANLRLLAQMLARAGYKVRKVMTGEMALQVVERVTPDLILLDIGLPGISGYDVCCRLKANPATAAIPIVFLSAYDQVANKTHAFEVGGADYITKPFQTAEVRARVEYQLKLRALTQRLEEQNAALQALVCDRDAEIVRRCQAERELQAANAELMRLANLDSLTGLANRRQFAETLAREWHRLQRDPGLLSLLLVDVDWFKLYNDTYGHPAGDHCLRRVALAMQPLLKRPADLLARYGGEEFAAILPQTDRQGAIARAEQLRRAVAALGLPHRRAPTGFVTVSIGAATVQPAPELELDEFLEGADRALYAAKVSGRDRVCHQQDRAEAGDRCPPLPQRGPEAES